MHHELNHLVFRHPLANPSDYPNRHARVIAEEVTVNEYVSEPLPGKPLTLADFPELPPDEDTHTRYQRLSKLKDLAERVRLLDMHCLWGEDLTDDAWISDSLSVQRALGHGPQRLGPDPHDIFQWALHPPTGVRPARAAIESLHGFGNKAQPLNWRSILAAVPSTRFGQESTYHRAPRRFPHLIGVFPGTTLRMEKPRAMVAIDTSGSMQGTQFERVQGELDRVREFTDVTVVHCDTEIRKTERLNGTLKEIIGRGGTDLRPPFQQSVIEKIRPTLIIYFTDGGGSAPKKAPHVPVIWCLTPSGKRPAPWGRVVRMKA